MLPSFEVCEVCCGCHSHANPGDNPSQLFSGTSVHSPRLYSGTVQLPGSTLSTVILKGLEFGKESISEKPFSETIFDLLVKTLCSPMNRRFGTNAGLGEKCVPGWEGVLIVCVSILSFLFFLLSIACFERL